MSFSSDLDDIDEPLDVWRYAGRVKARVVSRGKFQIEEEVIMGYPGKPTDDVMDLVRKLRALAETRGSVTDPEKLKALDDQLDDLEDEISNDVRSLDYSYDDYAQSIR